MDTDEGLSAGDTPISKRATDADSAARVRREVELLAALRHPGIVELLASDDDDNGYPSLETAHVGPSLAEDVRFSVEEAAGVLAAVATTVADLHDAGVVHGAIAPEHVLLAPDGRPVLCGFGTGGRINQLPVALPALPPGFDDPARRPTDRLQPPLDVYSLGALTRFLLSHSPSDAAPPARRRRRSQAVDSLLRLAAAATDADTQRRPTARDFAGGVAEAVPDARLPRSKCPDTGDEPDRWSTPATATESRPDVSLLTARRGRLATVTTRRPWRRTGRLGALVSSRRLAVIVVSVLVGSAGAVVGVRFIGDGRVRRSADTAAAGAHGEAGLPRTQGPASAPSSGEREPPVSPPPIPPQRCGVVDAVLAADVDGDGCTDAVGYRDGMLQAAGIRWQVGAPGDVVAVGDWRCTGFRTVALLRPSTGNVYWFDAWADEATELTAARVGRVDGAVAVRAADIDGDGCHELEVDRRDGEPAVLSVHATP